MKIYDLGFSITAEEVACLENRVHAIRKLALILHRRCRIVCVTVNTKNTTYHKIREKDFDLLSNASEI